MSDASKLGADLAIAAAKDSPNAGRYVAHAAATLSTFIKLGVMVMGWTPEQAKLFLNLVYEATAQGENLTDVTPAGSTVQ